MSTEPVILFTTNPAKVAEAEWVFGQAGVDIAARDYPFVEIQSLSPEEVLRNKIAQVQRQGSGRSFLVDDSGFYLTAYHRFPGTLSKFIYETIGYEGLLRLLPPGVDRDAYFESMIGLCILGKLYLFRGTTEGSVSSTARGPHREGMLFEPIFVPKGIESTLAELEVEERMSYSYRVKALSLAAQAYRHLI